MKGQLSEQPLAELIREISQKKLSGRLRVEHELVVVVVYFNLGELTYAAANARPFRLREYLLKHRLVNEEKLSRFDQRWSDLELADHLVEQQILSRAQANQIQLRQVLDVLHFGVLWIEGKWEFDSRPRLNSHVEFKVDVQSLLLEAGRRLPSAFCESRFRHRLELITPNSISSEWNILHPAEVFLLSRLEEPTPLNELIAMSGHSEAEAVRLIYSLALAGLVQREHWKNAFRGEALESKPGEDRPLTVLETKSHPEEVELADLNGFLARLADASSHYEVIGIAPDSLQDEIKTAYYDLARRYHPDRFRKGSQSGLLEKLESAFARVTQAYDTLRDSELRAAYDAKLRAKTRATETVKPATKAQPADTPSSPPPLSAAPNTDPERKMSDAERAEANFREGVVACELKQPKAAISCFAAAARLIPEEARFRAYYGHALAGFPDTRRLAESELRAAVKIEPNNPEYRIMLAELYLDLGFPVRARGELERALADAPNTHKARELLRTLK